MTSEVGAQPYAPAPVTTRYNAQPFNAFLLQVGQNIKRSLHSGEMQRVGLERLIREVDFGWFTKERTFTQEQFYGLLKSIAPTDAFAQALAQSFQVGQVYNAEFERKRLQIAHTTPDTYVISRP